MSKWTCISACTLPLHKKGTSRFKLASCSPSPVHAHFRSIPFVIRTIIAVRKPRIMDSKPPVTHAVLAAFNSDSFVVNWPVALGEVPSDN